MNEDTLFQKIIEILKPYTKHPELLDRATKETDIVKDLKVNSARLVDVIIKCEDVFGVSLDDDDADKIWTIGDAMAVIQKRLA